MLRRKLFEQFKNMETHKTSLIILILILIFAVIHSGGAALRIKAESIMGARLYRDEELFIEGKIESLKRFKDDVKEVKEGLECGIGLSLIHISEPTRPY